ncbi:ATP-binding cassette domain-containing protein [Streptacidiphilus cavernicola]|uniref:ATP-binding cassette domain-containing protein n=1 Tax=Streptacidiphilus cavernicola TaxID=3342716 RepID=A0ABV6W1I5_9ACTN
MFQAIGLTKSYRGGSAPAVLDLSFDAREGQVTALLGPEGSGRSTVLRLALGIERGQGVALFDGRPYRRLRRPERVVGTVLADPSAPVGHPGRRARGHLRMAAAAVGVPARHADQLLEQTRLAPAAGHRLRTFSPGMNQRLALAEALLGDPGLLLLDEPTLGLSPKNVEWFHAFLRAFAAGGGSVLVTLRDPREAAVLADRVVTLDAGRMTQDQTVAEFSRTRLHDEVSVRGPQVARLADLLAGTGAAVRADGGTRISVTGATRTEIGELAYRHGILLHELADRVVVEEPPRREALLVAARTPANPGTPADTRAADARAAAGPRAADTRAAHARAAEGPRAADTRAADTRAAESGSVEGDGLGETVVVISPGGSVSASVAGRSGTARSRVPAGPVPVSGPLYRDESVPTADLRSE